MQQQQQQWQQQQWYHWQQQNQLWHFQQQQDTAASPCTAHLPDYAVPGARVIVLGSRGGFDNHVRFHATVIKLLADGRAHVRFERDMEGNTLPICLPIIKTACERTTG